MCGVIKLILFVFCLSSAYGQQVKSFFEVGVSANGYKGDLSSAYEKWGSAVHLGYKSNAKKRLNFHANLAIGNITGQNANYLFTNANGNIATPNRYFKSKVVSANGDLQLNIFRKRNFTFYVSQGLGFMRFKPFDENNQALTNNFSSRESDETYSTTTIILPTNLGFFYTLRNGYGAGFQAGFQNPQSDYIDNISNWGTRRKNDNVLMYKFTFYVPLNFIVESKPTPAPTAPELAEIKDDDKDGLENIKDKCPDVFGSVQNEGCPPPVDTDKDQIPDSEDKCPEVAGTKEFQGCPAPVADKDSDGLIDSEDSCPEVAGILSNRGCPEIKQEDVVIIDKVKETLVFETGKALILPASYPALDSFAEQLKGNLSATIQIEGHTDNTGNETANQQLSVARAEAVKEYLVNKGVEGVRIKAIGFGSSLPIGDNGTEEGKAQNRRVEIRMIYK